MSVSVLSPLLSPGGAEWIYSLLSPLNSRGPCYLLFLLVHWNAFFHSFPFFWISMIIPHWRAGKWWRAIAGLLIRPAVVAAVITIIPNAASVKLTAWILTFISNIIDRLSVERGSTMAGYRVMSYSLDSGSFPPASLPELYARHWLVEVTYEWIGVSVYALSMNICALRSEGVEGVKGSAGACWCASRDRVKCRLGHLEPFSWIYCVRGGQGRAAAPPLPAHENFVSIGHKTDTRSSDKSLTRSVTDTQFGPEVMRLAGRPCGMASVLIDFLKWVSRESAGGSPAWW